MYVYREAEQSTKACNFVLAGQASVKFFGFYKNRSYQPYA